MDQRLGGLKRGLQHGGDLFVAQFSLAAEDERGPLLLGQGGQSFLDQAEQLTAGHFGIGGGLSAVLDLSERVLLVVRARFIERIGRMTHPSADLVEAEVAGDREEEGGEPGRGLVAARGLPELDEGGLRQVFGLVRVGQRAVDEADDRLLPSLHQVGEGVPITLSDAEHQQGVGILTGIGGVVGHGRGGDSEGGLRDAAGA